MDRDRLPFGRHGMTCTLVIGSGGYIGSNLRAAAGATPLVTVSSGTRARATHQVDWQARLPWDHPLLREAPERVFLLARPPQDDFDVIRRFQTHLQEVLLAWTRARTLRQIHFTSTASVYPGTQAERARISGAQVGPFALHPYFKLEMERFLQYLQLGVNPRLSVDVYRLPVGFGGVYDPTAHGNQPIYSFVDGYREGKRWPLDAQADAQWGTSWFHTTDLCERLWAAAPAPGYRIRDVSSGFVTYAELHDTLCRAFPSANGQPLPLQRSRFVLEDRLAMPRRDILEEVKGEIARVGSA